MFTSLADLIAYQLFALSASSHLGQAVHFFIEDTSKIFFMLVAVIYIMGWLRAMLSPERVRNYVRG